MEPIQRIHHISATVGDPNENLIFYRDVLNLRLVKKTVNFEDKNTYHLYFSNEHVDNGTIMTFFPIDNDLYGRVGGGQVRKIGFAIPKDSLGYWKEQLRINSVSFEETSIYQKSVLLFNDPHNLSIALVETNRSSENNNILGFYGVELLSTNPTETVQLLIHKMGLLLNEISNAYYHLEMPGQEKHQILISRKEHKKGRLGIGTVHHIAWSVEDEHNLKKWKDDFEQDFAVSPLEDRKYFKSIYTRDPGDMIYEFATEGPGFLIDESIDELGTQLMLPEVYERQRKEIEANLPVLKDK